MFTNDKDMVIATGEEIHFSRHNEQKKPPENLPGGNEVDDFSGITYVLATSSQSSPWAGCQRAYPLLCRPLQKGLQGYS